MSEQLRANQQTIKCQSLKSDWEDWGSSGSSQLSLPK